MDDTKACAERFITRCRRIAADARKVAQVKEREGDRYAAQRQRAMAAHWERRADKAERDFAEVAA